MTLTQQDSPSDANPTDGADSATAAVYRRETSDPTVVVADGYGIKISVERGHLVIADGIGRHRRVRKLPRVERTVRRIIVIGHTGYVTWEAARWCADVGITLVQVDTTGRLVSCSAAPSLDDARLRRAQAWCGEGGPTEHIGLEITKHVLSVKLDGQAVIADALGVPEVAAAIRDYADQVATASTITGARGFEGAAAAKYWTAWCGRVIVPFDPRELRDVPAHWTTYVMRSSPICTSTDNGKDAADPINALLNYAYRLAEVECRFACLSVGLDAGMGFLHGDELNRDSLALDLMETVRPEVDRFVLDLLSTFGPMRYLSRRLFIERPDGGCRLVAPLTHQVAEQAGRWARVVTPHAKHVARTVANVGKGEIRPTIAATQERHVRASGRAARAQARGGPLRLAGPVTVERIIPTDLWSQVEPMLPAKRTNRRGGRPFCDDRAVLAGIVCVEFLGCAWSKIPATFGVSRYTCSARLASWQQAGVWSTVCAALNATEHIRVLSTEAARHANVP
ncbi:CRISPR-associated endonuclease Cas1 [Amycolatopsis dongchuanensis]|uniref:CRISPR-associated endonuclease Cas1 n=1 Tax=Amycolatopsis dongchuanensis TaxID=1070866 RepID=A0ABP8VQ32_9PSEU